MRQGRLYDGSSSSAAAPSATSSSSASSSSSSSSSPSAAALLVIDILFHVSSFAKVVAAADPLEIIGTESERNAFIELKNIFVLLKNSNKGDNINIKPFLDKLSQITNFDYSNENNYNEIFNIWDDIVKVIMAVIPPLREIFVGQVASAQDAPGWINIMSRCFKAHFTDTSTSLEDVCKNCFQAGTDKSSGNGGKGESSNSTLAESYIERVRNTNAMMLKRAPEILVVSIESGHLGQSKENRISAYCKESKAPASIIFPDSFDLNYIRPPGNNGNNSNGQTNRDFNNNIYDLTAVIALEGPLLDSRIGYFRIPPNATDGGREKWYCGAGTQSLEEVSKARVIEGNFYGFSSDRCVHPRFLIYTRRDLPLVLDRSITLVSKAGQLRALGDVAFALATTTDNYTEARQCYEEAISLDESLRPILQANLNDLDRKERTQKSRALEDQADLALANKRYKECGDMYTKAMAKAIYDNALHQRLSDKADNVKKLITLETLSQCCEDGDEALSSGNFVLAREKFAFALRINNDLLYLQQIVAGIDKNMLLQTSNQKMLDANNAMKSGKFKLANTLYHEAIALVPEKTEALQSTLDGLVTLMQGEDASLRHKAGLQAVDDKKYAAAVTLITEAMELLPEGHPRETALFFCDRALAQYELKDYNAAIKDCNEALTLKPDFGMAFFRLGASKFGLDLYDEATACYDKALKADSSLGESVKVKMRQVNTAREVRERKERESRREEEEKERKRLLEERKVKDELLKKERAEKAAKEKADKAEKKRKEEEEKKLNSEKSKEERDREEKEKEEKKAAEKAERDALKAAEKTAKLLEKEREKERVRVEKEQKLVADRLLAQQELKRKQDMAEELERNRERQREAEREREAEKERLRIDREKLIVEREKARQEKLRAEKEEAEKKKLAAPAPAPAAPAAPATPHTPTKSTPLQAEPALSLQHPTSAAESPAALAQSTPKKTAWNQIVASPGGNSAAVTTTTTASASASTSTTSSQSSAVSNAGASNGSSSASNGSSSAGTGASSSGTEEAFPVLGGAKKGQPGYPPLAAGSSPAVKESAWTKHSGASTIKAISTAAPIRGSTPPAAAGSPALAAAAAPALPMQGLGGDIFHHRAPDSSDSFLPAADRLLSASIHQPLSGLRMGDDLDLTSLSSFQTSSTTFGGLGFGGLGGLSGFGASSTSSSSSFFGNGTAGSALHGGLPSYLSSADSDLDISDLTNSIRDINGLDDGPSYGLGDINSGIGGMSGLTGNLMGGLGMGGLGINPGQNPSRMSSRLIGDGYGLAVPTSDPSSLGSMQQSPRPLVGGPSGMSQFPGSYAPLQGLGGSGLGIAPPQPNRFTDANILAEHYFPSLMWLRQYGVFMFKWGVNNSEFAMSMPSSIYDMLVGIPDPVTGISNSKLGEIQGRTGCKVWVDFGFLNGKQTQFLILHRGPQGHPSNVCMSNALDLISNILKNPNQSPHPVSQGLGSIAPRMGGVWQLQQQEMDIASKVYQQQQQQRGAASVRPMPTLESQSNSSFQGGGLGMGAYPLAGPNGQTGASDTSKFSSLFGSSWN